MAEPSDLATYPVVAPLDDDEQLLALASYEISAGFDAVLSAKPPSAIRVSAALAAVTTTAATVILMMPREVQTLCLAKMVKTIRQQLKGYAAEPPSSTH